MSSILIKTENSDYIRLDNDPDAVTIDIKYHNDNPKLSVTDIGDWCDLYVAEDSFIEKGERKYISMGVSMKLPDGYEAIMAPRSSTFKRWGIIMTNSIGVIDNSYCGDDDIWQFPAYNLQEDIRIPKGTRICQFRIQKKQPKLIFNQVASLGNINRGGLGAGTGI